MSEKPHVDWTRLAEWGVIRFGNADLEKDASNFFHLAEAVIDAAGCKWMSGRAYLALCESPIIGMFLMHVHVPATKSEQWQWVVVGDLPEGLLPVEAAFNQYQALCSYIVDVRRVLNGQQPLSLTLPGWAAPSCYAERATLERKLAVLEEHMITPARHLL